MAKLLRIPLLCLFLLSWVHNSCAQLYPGNLFNNSEDTIIMWLKADSGALSNGNPSENGDEVTTWLDLSGARSTDATNNDEISSPTYHHNASNHMNYNPTLNFDGTGSGLNFGSDYVFPDGGIIDLGILGSALGFKCFKGMTVFTVQKPTSTNTSKNLQFIYDIGSYDLEGFGSVYNANSSMFYSPEGTLGTVINGTLSTLLDILAWILGSSNVSNSNTSGLISHSYGNNQSISRTTVVTGSDILGILLGGASKSASINGTNYYSASNFSLIQLNLNSILGASEHYNYSGPFTIGRQSRNINFNNNNIRAFEGQIAEIVGYTGVLSDAETNRIESYLALKYGVTLNFGGTENGNYTSSNGSTVWNASSATATYHNDIIGIARDDDSGLLQKQSHTQDDSLRVYLDDLDTTNSANQGSFSNNQSFLIIGSNGDDLYAQNYSTEKPSGIYSRLGREWRIQSTNFTDTFSIDITLNNFASNNGIDINDLYLLVDNDGDFSNADMYVNTVDVEFNISGNVLTISGIHPGIIPNNSANFFTIGSGSGNTPLPVQLIDFTVKEIEQTQVELNWKTATENNNDYYSIYHSTNGEHWLPLEKVKAAGNTEVELLYNYVHTTAQWGQNYYKLVQTDLNGDSSELGIRNVNLKSSQVELMIYPNPVTNGLHVVGSLDLEAEIYIINALGLTTKVDDYTVLSEEHILINTNFLSKGMYALVINNQTLRFNKL